MWRSVGLVLTDVSEERIASIFRVPKFASEALVLAVGCRLSHQWEVTSIVRTEQCEKGNVGPMGNQQKGWGGVCWVCVEGQRQVAEYYLERAVCRSRLGKGYKATERALSQ
jgi:hypothetical protein